MAESTHPAADDVHMDMLAEHLHNTDQSLMSVVEHRLKAFSQSREIAETTEEDA